MDELLFEIVKIVVMVTGLSWNPSVIINLPFVSASSLKAT